MTRCLSWCVLWSFFLSFFMGFFLKFLQVFPGVFCEFQALFLVCLMKDIKRFRVNKPFVDFSTHISFVSFSSSFIAGSPSIATVVILDHLLIVLISLLNFIYFNISVFFFIFFLFEYSPQYQCYKAGQQCCKNDCLKDPLLIDGPQSANHLSSLQHANKQNSKNNTERQEAAKQKRRTDECGRQN